MAVLSVRLPAEAKTGKAGHGRPCRRCRARAGLEEYVAQARGFFLGAAAFFFGIDSGRRDGRRYNGLPPVLRIEDRAAKVAW